MKRTIKVILVSLICLAGCSNMSATEQRVLSGGALGAGGGALIGAAAGSAAIGAAVGGGAGLLGGFVYDQYQKSRETSQVKQSSSRAPSKPGTAKKTQVKLTPRETSPPDVM